MSTPATHGVIFSKPMPFDSEKFSLALSNLTAIFCPKMSLPTPLIINVATLLSHRQKKYSTTVAKGCSLLPDHSPAQEAVEEFVNIGDAYPQLEQVTTGVTRQRAGPGRVLKCERHQLQFPLLRIYCIPNNKTRTEPDHDNVFISMLLSLAMRVAK